MYQHFIIIVIIGEDKTFLLLLLLLLLVVVFIFYVFIYLFMFVYLFDNIVLLLQRQNDLFLKVTSNAVISLAQSNFPEGHASSQTILVVVVRI